MGVESAFVAVATPGPSADCPAARTPQLHGSSCIGKLICEDLARVSPEERTEMESATSGGLRIGMAGLRDSIGRSVGYTEWTAITQEEVDQFADLTGDHNFLHVDPDRAATTPFGGTIAHGFLSLSLLAPVTQRLEVTDDATAVNYGLDKVRFPTPLPVGAQLRGTAQLTEVTEIKGGLEAKMTATIEVMGSERPAVVADTIVGFYA